jgi:carboxylate-amine ligase
VDLPANERVATRALARRLLGRLREHAQDLGAADELEGVLDLLEHGNGAYRQRKVYEANRDFSELLQDIVAASAP